MGGQQVTFQFVSKQMGDCDWMMVAEIQPEGFPHTKKPRDKGVCETVRARRCRVLQSAYVNNLSQHPRQLLARNPLDNINS